MHHRRGRHRLFALAALFAAPAPLSAHPHTGPQYVAHEHTPLGLEVGVADDGVTCNVLLSNGFFNLLIPRERGRLKLARRGEVFAFLDPAQEAAERDAFAAFFADTAPRVLLDDVPVPVTFAHFEMLPSVDPSGVLDHSLAPPDARVVLRFPAATPPQRLRLEWTLFPVGLARDAFGQARPPELPVQLDAYAETRIVTLTPEQPVLEWQKPTAPIPASIAPVELQQVSRSRAVIPLVSLGLVAGWLVLLVALRVAQARRSALRGALLAGIALLAGAYATRHWAPFPVGVRTSAEPAPLTTQAAERAFMALLRNVYRAFDYKSESDIYDVLAKSVDGAQLDAIYNEVYQSLLAREQGGAVARVKDMTFVTIDIEPPPADASPSASEFHVRCRWRVHGVVHHWGHVHERTNEYKARYTVARRADLWKITGCELLGQRRLGKDEAGPAAAPAAGSTPS